MSAHVAGSSTSSDTARSGCTPLHCKCPTRANDVVGATRTAAAVLLRTTKAAAEDNRHPATAAPKCIIPRAVHILSSRGRAQKSSCYPVQMENGTTESGSYVRVVEHRTCPRKNKTDDPAGRSRLLFHENLYFFFVFCSLFACFFVTELHGKAGCSGCDALHQRYESQYARTRQRPEGSNVHGART